MGEIKNLGNLMREIGFDDVSNTPGPNCLTENIIKGVIARRKGIDSHYKDSLKFKQGYVEKHIAKCSHCLKVLDDSMKLERYE